MEREKTPGIFVFVGENRSKMAQERGWSWQECQRTGVPKNAATILWGALKQSKLKLNPNEQIFFNLWDDEWNPAPFIPDILKEMAEDGEVIVAMGQKVHKELAKQGIPHRKMVHPAARGPIRKTSLYQEHVKKVLS